MSLDGKILARAAERMKLRLNSRENAYKAIRDKIYAELPSVARIDALLSLSAAEAAKAALDEGGDPAEAIEKAAQKNLELQAERAEILVMSGYAMDVLDEKPYCSKCSDRGYVKGTPCKCLIDLYAEEQKKELSALLKLGEETFDSFVLEYYGTERESGFSPRESMELVYETCLEYARKFNSRSANLFLTGGPGLGKTFLSACIAKEVSENGYSVVYDTAISVFSKFEDEKFSKDSFREERDIERYLQCDLLIFDDLGTEMTTAFTVSALYDIINTRLTSKKQTIISSNLSIGEIRRRYSAQIASRLEGEYQKLAFYGKDIRLLKKER